MAENKKVLLILLYDCRGLSTFPAVLNCAKELKNRGFFVKIITRAQNDLDENVFDEIESISLYKSENILLNIIKLSRVIFNNRQFEYVFCFDPIEAIYTSIASLFSRQKFIYYNLEIFEKYKRYTLRKARRYLFMKSLEKIFCKMSYCFVIQDKVRKNISEKYGIKHKRNFYIPNSYCGYHGNEFFMKRQGVIFTGGLEKWAIEPIVCNAGLFRSVNLTLSGWSRDNYLDKVEKILCNNNIKIKRQSLSTSELFKFIQQYKIGLVMYTADRDNVYYIGRSSGKFFLYLSLGLPVIVMDLPGISDDVERYKIGIVIKSIEDIPRAVREIEENYEFYSDNVKNTYLEIFEYHTASKPFFDFLQQL